MLKLFRTTKEFTTTFCERCGQVCTSACRRDALLARARERALVTGVRFL